MKTCTKCHEEKPLSEFNRHKGKKDGRESQCKSCRMEYRIENRERDREQKRIYRQKNADKIAEQTREYRERNPIYLRMKSREAQRSRQRYTSYKATKRGEWSPAEDEILLADDGLSIPQKALLLGRTYYSAKSRRHKLLN